jgi:hypothetical protein
MHPFPLAKFMTNSLQSFDLALTSIRPERGKEYAITPRRKTFMTHRMMPIPRSLFIAGASLCLLFSSCASSRIKRLSGVEFLRQAEEMKQTSSFNWTTYVGASGSRAYLESGYPALIGEGTRTTVYWTPLKELPPEVAAQIKADRPKWRPAGSPAN